MNLWIIYCHEIPNITYSDVNIKKIYISDISIDVSASGINLLVDGENVEYPNICITKIGSINTELSLFIIEIIKILESKKTVCLNSSLAYETLFNKYKNAVFINKLNLNHAKTFFVSNKNIGKFENKFNYPIVIKQNNGSLGLGMCLVKSFFDLYDIINFNYFKFNEEQYILQDYIEESHGKDVRVLVLGKNILGCILRQSNGKFQSNYCDGKGNVIKYEIDDKIINIVNKITDNLPGGYFLGIDLLFCNNEYFISEINLNSGFDGFNKIHDININDKIIKFLINKYNENNY